MPLSVSFRLFFFSVFWCLSRSRKQNFELSGQLSALQLAEPKNSFASSLHACFRSPSASPLCSPFKHPSLHPHLYEYSQLIITVDPSYHRVVFLNLFLASTYGSPSLSVPLPSPSSLHCCLSRPHHDRILLSMDLYLATHAPTMLWPSYFSLFFSCMSVFSMLPYGHATLWQSFPFPFPSFIPIICIYILIKLFPPPYTVLRQNHHYLVIWATQLAPSFVAILLVESTYYTSFMIYV